MIWAANSAARRTVWNGRAAANQMRRHMSRTHGLTAEARRELVERLARFTRSRRPRWQKTIHPPVPAQVTKVDRTGRLSEAMLRELALIERASARLVDERA